jgi:iron complex outermembrane receptor protein
VIAGLHLFFQVDNLFDRVYAASAGVISDGLNAGTGQLNPVGVLAAGSGAFYAGSPRAFSAGVRVKF